MNKFTWSDPPSNTALPIAKAGYPLIFAAAFTTAILALLKLVIPAVLALLATFFICYFFRDPDRVIPSQAKAIVAPADGKVIVSELTERSPYYSGKCRRISIFMSVFNVHVNRIAYNGTVEKINYQPGKFIAANHASASMKNEHNALLIKTEEGSIGIVQIAGLIARRIICSIKEGESVIRGQRFGMICFGSRLDVYLPSDTNIKVAVGAKVQAGTTILGYFS